MITVNNEILTNALSKVVKAANGRLVPLLGNVCITASGGSMRLCCTNAELQLETSIRCDGDLSVTVDAKKLHAICANSSADIKLELKDGKLLVKSGRSRSTLATLPVEDFPDLGEDLGEVQGMHVSAEAIKGVSHAMAKQDVRYYLNGMLFQRSDGYVHVVATDGHRLAVHKSDQGGDDCSAIIPRNSVSALIGIAGPDTLIKVSDRMARVESDDVTLTTKLIDGKFPDWNRVMPDTSYTCEVSRELFTGSLSRVGVTANEKYKGVRLKIENGTLEFSSNNPSQESAVDTIDVKAANPLEHGYNIGYLSDAANCLDSDVIELNYTQGDRLVLTNESNVKCVVMGMRL